LKTVIEWLNTLPPGYRERALNNLNPVGQSREYESLHGALASRLTFVWKDIQEGEAFWGEVYRHYTVGSSLPPLPTDSSKPVNKPKRLVII